MPTLRPAEERGQTYMDWLNSRHTFSFGNYHDHRHMGYGALRVINDDIVQPGGGFAPHRHQDMEILTYVLDGALAHQDSMGNGSTLRPGDVQCMTAGTGIQHSEFNASQTDLVHFLQIWIIPHTQGLPPGYAQQHFDSASRTGQWRLIASEGGQDGSIRVHQDVAVYALILRTPGEVVYTMAPGRQGWLHVATGQVAVGSHVLGAGDALAVSPEESVTLTAVAPRSELLFFDLKYNP